MVQPKDYIRPRSSPKPKSLARDGVILKASVNFLQCISFWKDTQETLTLVGCLQGGELGGRFYWVYTLLYLLTCEPHDCVTYLKLVFLSLYFLKNNRDKKHGLGVCFPGLSSHGLKTNKLGSERLRSLPGCKEYISAGKSLIL